MNAIHLDIKLTDDGATVTIYHPAEGRNDYAGATTEVLTIDRSMDDMGLELTINPTTTEVLETRTLGNEG